MNPTRIDNYLEKESKFNNKLLSNRLLKQITSLLGDPKKFNKANIRKRNIIFQRVKKLSVFIGYANVLNNIINETPNSEKDYKLFEEIFITKVMSAKIVRKDSGILKNRLHMLIKFLISRYEKEGYISHDVDINIKNVISLTDSKEIFYSILMETALASIVYFSTKKEEDKIIYKMNNDVDKNDIIESYFVEEVIKKLMIWLSRKILNNNIQTGGAIEKLYDEMPIIIGNNDNNFIEQVGYQLIEIFIESTKAERRVIYDTYTPDIRRSKELALITLPNKYTKGFIPSTHLPDMLPIKSNFSKNNTEDMLTYAKKIKNGISSLKLSERTKKSLTLSQSKKFKINPNCIETFEELDSMPYNTLKNLEILPFTPIPVLKQNRTDIRVLENKLSPENEKILEDIFIMLKRNKLYTDDIAEKIHKHSQIPKEDIENFLLLKLLRKEYYTKVKLRTLHNTVIELAKIFNGFPIYFAESFDYRLRMYPYVYMFSRTSGIYKYLVYDYKSSKLTFKGMGILFEAFYKEFPDKMAELSKINSIEELKKFNENNINIPVEKIITLEPPIYKLVLQKELQLLKHNNYKTSIMIEVDQRSSATVLLSLILGNEHLGRITNLLSKDQTADLPLMLMGESSSWFSTKEMSDEGFKNFTTERQIHKRLVMLFGYGLTYIGRLAEARKCVTNEKDAQIIAKQYTNFIDEAIPNLSNQKKLLNSLIREFLNLSKEGITIKTLDGSVLYWRILKKIMKKSTKGRTEEGSTKKYYSLFSKTNKSYYSSNYEDQTSINKMIASFLASYTHSVDGALMRLVILEVYDRTDYIISHLHDSIQFHPNHYDNIMESILDVYTANDLGNLIDKTLLIPLRSKVKTEEDRKIINDKIIEFKNSRTEFEVMKNNFNVKGMFRLE
jgi:hypothetical protein